MANENMFLFYALIMGIFITFLYDIIRIFRNLFPHNAFLTALEDLGFWVYCAIRVFILMYHESDGTLRWFAVLGALAGMLLYKKTISKFLVKYVSLVLGKIIEFLGKPIKKMARALKKVGRFLRKKLTFFVKVLRMKI